MEEQLCIRTADTSDIKVFNSVTITSPVATRPDWSAPICKVGGHEFVEMAKGDRSMQAWVVGDRKYSTKASNLIVELCDLQKHASAKELSGDDVDQMNKGKLSSYRKGQQKQALKQLSEGKSSSVVDVILPSFTSKAGEVIAAVNTVMPLNVAPTKAMVKVTADVLLWTVIRADTIEAKPNVSGKGAPKGTKRKDKGTGARGPLGGMPFRRTKVMRKGSGSGASKQDSVRSGESPTD